MGGTKGAHASVESSSMTPMEEVQEAAKSGSKEHAVFLDVSVDTMATIRRPQTHDSSGADSDSKSAGLRNLLIRAKAGTTAGEACMADMYVQGDCGVGGLRSHGRQFMSASASLAA